MTTMGPLPLNDIRKQQRRVAALLNISSDSNLRYPLRRKAAPPIFCYVCSRVDPSGVFRNRNSYLFRHGFFNKCEHMLQGPHPTFVRTAVMEQDEKDDDEYKTMSIKGPTRNSHTTSIGVTIEMRSDVEVNYVHDYLRSPTKTAQFIENPQDDKEKRRVDEKKVFRLPPVFGTVSASIAPVQKENDGRLVPFVGEKTFLEAGEYSDNGNNQIHRDQMPTRTKNGEPLTAEEAEEDLVEIAPLISDQISLRSSKIWHEGNVKQLRTEFPSSSSSSFAPGSFSTQKRRSLAKMDGISVLNDGPAYSTGSQLHNSVPGSFSGDFDSFGSPTRRSRPLGGRFRSRTTRDDAYEDDMHSDISTGTIRYHHRTSEDSVPDAGFVIPKTPKPLTEFEKQDLERFEREIALGNRGLSATTKLTTTESLISLPDSNSFIIQRMSGQFCECSPGERRTAVNPDICVSCGKKIRKGTLSSLMTTDDSDTPSSVQRPTHGIKRSISRQSKPNEHSHLSRTMTDEDYLDIEKIIQEDEGNYFNSEADEDVFEDVDGDDATLSSVRRFREAKPFPTVDPEIHKEAYLRALQEARGKRLARIKKFEDFEEGFKLRRPNLFSYFPLWPIASEKCEQCGHVIGLRADQGNIPKSIKNGKLMKHIFGDVKVDDYYPGGKGNPQKLEKKNDVKSDTKQKPKQKPVLKLTKPVKTNLN
ncbi:hypothetical protein CHS0354_024981 [Potamilus streckersoni]|nr:hypothetical protein CHS0354_024981 [Potamilus streckersoni]